MGSYIYSDYCEDKDNENTANINSIWSLFGYEENNVNKDDAKYNNNNASKSWLQKIRIERGVIEHFMGYQGKIQYYKVGNWTSHGSVLVRKEEGNNKFAAKCHLILNSYSTGYIVQVEKSTWRPNIESIVTDSKHSWNIIKALSAVYQVSSHFGAWNYFMNNCQHFRNDVVNTMLHKGPKHFAGIDDGEQIDLNNFWDALEEINIDQCVEIVANKKVNRMGQ